MNEEQWPKAYREGRVDFYGRGFLVSPDVLIPRPETEMAVDVVLELAGKAILAGVKAPERKLGLHPRILDVGTGSGCIALTLAAELPEAEVVAGDVSEAALKVARKNAQQLEVGKRVRFVKSDLLDGVRGEFDVVVANLPYVDRSWEWLKEPESAGLKYEPELALYAARGGLAVIFRLIEEIEVRSKGEPFCKWLVLEADPCQHGEVRSYAERHGFCYVETRGYQVVFRHLGA
ncbi:peptide chain release factor N(5)-glutamine methyltransferase [Candidatus Saccharibacteria bacterium]|nr:peptide chain release factor N(5)-glutamine methyltransferase [Candidatus Saccharibacteria bacterium]